MIAVMIKILKKHKIHEDDHKAVMQLRVAVTQQKAMAMAARNFRASTARSKEIHGTMRQCVKSINELAGHDLHVFSVALKELAKQVDNSAEKLNGIVEILISQKSRFDIGDHGDISNLEREFALRRLFMIWREGCIGAKVEGRDNANATRTKAPKGYSFIVFAREVFDALGLESWSHAAGFEKAATRACNKERRRH